VSDTGTTDPGGGPPAESELEQLRAERARLVEGREQRTAARAVADELDRMRTAIADEEAIAKAECEFGPIDRDIAVVQSRGHGAIIVKRPTHAGYRAMIDAVSSGKLPLSTINERFTYPCLVHPDKLAFERLLKAEPALLEHVASAAAKLAGLVVEEVQSK
jgi:hypothetical protein